MNLSLGFTLIALLVLLPGLIFRRLYFYGEFSKQFDSGLRLSVLLGKAIMPGLGIALFCFVLIDKLYSAIDLDKWILQFKFLNGESIQSKTTSDKDMSFGTIINDFWPFVGFLYASSIILGLLGGRLVRYFNLDTRFKLLRFNNTWFYLLTGNQTMFKRFRAFRSNDKQFLFSKADVLFNCADKTRLYTGVVVDYQIAPNDCSKLSKLILTEAERYGLGNGAIDRKPIPGQFFVVDCSNLVNLNLTHVYQNRPKTDWKTKLPRTLLYLILIFALLCTPLFVFESGRITRNWYHAYFKLDLLLKLLIYCVFLFIIGMLYPYFRVDGKYERINGSVALARLLLIVIAVGTTLVILYLLG